MSIPDKLLRLNGSWQATNRLWLSPEEAVRESEAKAVISTIAQGKFLVLRYTWSEQGQPQDGLLLVGSIAEAAEAVWVDSWHMQDKHMLLTGKVAPDGSVRMRGSYAAPSGPDWGWRIDLLIVKANSFQFMMYNLPPDGEETLAVEAVFKRVS
jgi:hypothetical protein